MFNIIPHVSMKEEFKQELYNYYMNLFLQEIRLHIIRNNERDFFDLDGFRTKNGIDQKMFDDMVKQIMTELEKCGWKHHLGFGDTGLWIYSGDKPHNAW